MVAARARMPGDADELEALSDLEHRRERELTETFEAVRTFARQDIGLQIFKNGSFSQFIRQAEIDVLGVRWNQDVSSPNVIAVNSAFHEAGLQYGDADETVGRVLKKLIRGAFALEACLNLVRPPSSSRRRRWRSGFERELNGTFRLSRPASPGSAARPAAAALPDHRQRGLLERDPRARADTGGYGRGHERPLPAFSEALMRLRHSRPRRAPVAEPICPVRAPTEKATASASTSGPPWRGSRGPAGYRRGSSGTSSTPAIARPPSLWAFRS